MKVASAVQRSSIGQVIFEQFARSLIDFNRVAVPVDVDKKRLTMVLCQMTMREVSGQVIITIEDPFDASNSYEAYLMGNEFYPKQAMDNLVKHLSKKP